MTFVAAITLPINTVAAGEEKTTVGVAAGAGRFNTLFAAMKAAGLVDTLNGAGPFTVFAPNDEGFAKLPVGTGKTLLKPENKEKLAAILSYHGLSGRVMAADVKTMSAKTVNGEEASIKGEGGEVTIGVANFVKTDIATSNGAVYVIDTVLIR